MNSGYIHSRVVVSFGGIPALHTIFCRQIYGNLPTEHVIFKLGEHYDLAIPSVRSRRVCISQHRIPLFHFNSRGLKPEGENDSVTVLGFFASIWALVSRVWNSFLGLKPVAGFVSDMASFLLCVRYSRSLSGNRDMFRFQKKGRIIEETRFVVLDHLWLRLPLVLYYIY